MYEHVAQSLHYLHHLFLIQAIVVLSTLFISLYVNNGVHNQPMICVPSKSKPIDSKPIHPANIIQAKRMQSRAAGLHRRAQDRGK